MSNPHLDMANDVFDRMFGLPKITPPDPIADQETECGILAQNADISQSESTLYPLSDAQMDEGNITEERR